MSQIKLFWWNEGAHSKAVKLDGLTSASDLEALDIPASFQPVIQNLLRAREGRPLVFMSSGTTAPPSPVISKLNLSVDAKPAVDGIWATTFRSDTFGAFDVLRQAFRRQMFYLNLFQQWDHIDQWRGFAEGLLFLSTTPSWIRYLQAQAHRPLPGFDRVYLSGEPVRAADFELTRSLFPGADIMQIYGLTETGTLLLSRTEEFQLVAHGENTLMIDDSGELIAKNRDGSFHRTKDIFERTSSGGWVFAGRKDRRFKVAGFLIHPEKIERYCEQLPGVLAARIYAVPSALTENIAGIKLVIEPGIEHKVFEKEFYATLSSLFPRHEIPQRIEYVTQLIDPGTGKKGEGL